ncbi:MULTISPECIES: cardiolipin synthase [Paenibacillus]|jgi:cardiolipin synthase|uniref:Cardiolipin synthase n=1 Tax=Paenibacillus oceani TaxID=2772510 RepID=A0A927H0R2_9BACL|nr:cardiolipin synthase [Paenibacillus oceani]MBD2863960.1 cardiolipin synthase [Paenibacillus oceani]MDF2661485.1 cardiolipin synthase [Paenibacillus sp.]
MEISMQNVYSLLSLLNLLLAATVIFLERRNVGVTWAWLMVLFFLPGIGFLLYLFLGQNLSRRKIYKIKAEQREFVNDLVERQKRDIRQIRFHDPAMIHFQDMIYLNLASGQSIYTQDNDIEIFTEGRSKFNSLLADISKAKHHIHLMYYIVKNDKLGRSLIQALARKAREGVEVRFLYDHIGSPGLSKRFFRPLTEAGGRTAAFFPPKIPYLNFRLNYRNHRKLAIIDGSCGYIGGLNVGDEYLGLDKRFGDWRDTHLKVRGGGLFQMQMQFLLDWNLSSEAKVAEVTPYFPSARHPGKVGMQVVSSGPNNDLEQIKKAYIKMIHAAKQSVWIQTPYFVPDESLMTSLKMAALSGVDVRLMLPGKPDHKLVYWASTSYLGELLSVGVKCYLYDKGFLHAKTIVVDGRVASVGTANIDLRSFKLNFEVNAFLYDTATATALQDIFLEDQRNSTELTEKKYLERPLFKRFLESCARLLSPLL